MPIPLGAASQLYPCHHQDKGKASLEPILKQCVFSRTVAIAASAMSPEEHGPRAFTLSRCVEYVLPTAAP